MGHGKFAIIISNVDDDYSTVCKATGHGASENVTRTVEFMQFRSDFYFYNPSRGERSTNGDHICRTLYAKTTDVSLRANSS